MTHSGIINVGHLPFFLGFRLPQHDLRLRDLLRVIQRHLARVGLRIRDEFALALSMITVRLRRHYLQEVCA